MAHYFGIDFGTTNSAVVALAEENGEILEEYLIGEDNRPLPSFVAIHKETGEIQTGMKAKNSISTSEEYTVFPSIKSLIGENRTWEIAGKKWSQIEIAAELFKALKKNVEKICMEELREATIAVPVGFASNKKNNIRKAAKLAGIDINMFISEPTSAYIGRAETMKRYKNVVVFDWGGGTLDVVVLRIEGNMIYEEATTGINIAGNDIDKRIAERICLKVAKRTNQDFSFSDLDPEIQLRLLNVCEKAKCDLADEDIVNIALAKLGEYGRVWESIDYDYFSLLIENEVNKAFECLLQAINEAGLNVESVDCILCEGGSSRLRPLHTRLIQAFGREKLILPKKAMWDIACGAAEIAYNPGCYALNKSIGVMLSNNQFYPLLKRGQRVPTEEKTIRFGIVEKTNEARFVLTDGATEVEQSFLEYFPVKTRGFSDESIEVSCYIDSDMVFRMKAKPEYAPDDFFKVWTYSNLKVLYEMNAPEPEEYIQ